MDRKLRMAVVGAGTWGENHARLYLAHPGCTCCAICDVDPKRARSLADRLGIADAYGDVEAMLRGSEIDAVAIVTPDFAHADAAVAAAEAGKHLLIEKPIATTRADIARILKAARGSGVRLMVDLHNRWNPPFHAAWEAVRAGELGDIRSAYMRLNDIVWVATDLLPWAAKSSILWFLGSHSVDTLRWIIGDEVQTVYAVKREGTLRQIGIDTVDLYQTTLRFKGGAVAQMENSWITPNGNGSVNDIKFNVLGSEGMIDVDTSSHGMIRKVNRERSVVPDVLVQHRIFDHPAGFAFESIRSFVDCLLSGEPFKVSVEDAVRTSQVILAIQKSAESGLPVEVDYTVEEG